MLDRHHTSAASRSRCRHGSTGMTSGAIRNAATGSSIASRGTSRRCMQLHYLIIASLALALPACAPATPSAAPVDTASEAAICTVEAFDRFIERFSRDAAFQRRATADPLIVERYDTAAEPEPRRVESNVALADVAWPVMPSLERLADSGRTHTVASGADGRMDVVIRTPDTSDQQIYVFRQTPCWQLQRVIDESI